MTKTVFLVLSLLSVIHFGLCQSNKSGNFQPKVDKARQHEISKIYSDSAQQYHYFDQGWQTYLNKGLELDSTIAYLWQQKAMPMFKLRKYELGMRYLDKAVEYNKERFLGYRAFIKCIFAKTYKDALIDLEACLNMHGNIPVMDHTYNFYKALCYLQLGEFNKAEPLFIDELSAMEQKWGKDGVHHLELFYLGIVQYELRKFEEAIRTFDSVLKIYPRFSDAKYYKGLALRYNGGKTEEILALFSAAANDLENGYTINEDNAIYEPYPYQIYPWYVNSYKN